HVKAEAEQALGGGELVGGAARPFPAVEQDGNGIPGRRRGVEFAEQHGAVVGAQFKGLAAPVDGQARRPDSLRADTAQQGLQMGIAQIGRRPKIPLRPGGRGDGTALSIHWAGPQVPQKVRVTTWCGAGGRVRSASAGSSSKGRARRSTRRWKGAKSPSSSAARMACSTR